MVLAPKKTPQQYKSMEQDRKPKNKPMHTWSFNLQQRKQDYTMEERQVSSINGAGKTGQLHGEKIDKSKRSSVSHRKNNLKVD